MSSVIDPYLIRSSIVSASLANFRIVMVGPRSASGGMMTFTRDPSLSRASTIGDDSSTRRPMLLTILSMTCINCWSLSKVTGLNVSLPCCST